MADDSLTDPEDLKLVTLARSSLARAIRNEGAAVRDTDGRTFTAASVHLAHLRLSAVEMAVAMAAASGVRGLESVVVVGNDRPVSDGDVAIAAALGGSGIPVHRTTPSGALVETRLT